MTSAMQAILDMDQSAGKPAQIISKAKAPTVTNHTLMAEELAKPSNSRDLRNGALYTTHNATRTSTTLAVVSAHQIVQQA